MNKYFLVLGVEYLFEQTSVMELGSQCVQTHQHTSWQVMMRVQLGKEKKWPQATQTSDQMQVDV